MVILKKITSATLVEALVATVIVVIIFAIASLTLNNLVLNSFAKRDHTLEYRLNELEYAICNNKIILPYKEKYEDWNITITEKNDSQSNLVLYVALNEKTNKEIERKRVHEN